MNHILPEAHRMEITLQAKHANEFENFCHRNEIPFVLHYHTVDEHTYLVRAGIDCTDALIMVFKMKWDKSEQDSIDALNALNALVFTHNYFAPEYEYELTVGLRNLEDEIILCNFVALS